MRQDAYRVSQHWNPHSQAPIVAINVRDEGQYRVSDNDAELLHDDVIGIERAPEYGHMSLIPAVTVQWRNGLVRKYTWESLVWVEYGPYDESEDSPF